MYTSLAEALKKPDQITALKITKEDIKAGIPADVVKLTHVKALNVEGEENVSLPFPKQLLDLPVTELDIHHFRVFEVAGFKSLRKLDLASHFIHDDILPLCKQFTQLTSLSIWGYHPRRALVLPPEIVNLSQLEELELVTCAMENLPDELSQLTKLRKVTLRNHKFKTFPLVLIKIPNLEALEFSSAPLVTSLPDEMAQMKRLRSLDLNHNFKGKEQTFDEELDSFFDELTDGAEKKGFKAPQVLSELTNLEALSLKHCDIGDVSAIAKLTKLKSLNLAGAKMKNTDQLHALENLEDLDLSYGYDLRDVSAVSKMRQLKKLNIEATRDIDDLAPIMTHPSLESLVAGDDVLELWKQRKALLELPPKEKILALLTSTNIKEVATGIEHLTTFAVTNSAKSNGLFTFFDLNKKDYDETEVIDVDVLSALIQKHGAQLSPQSLVSLVKAGLAKEIYDNFKVTLDAIEILIERKDVESQKKVVEIFKKACEYYDAGHRFWEETVQDQLIDLLFPQFEGDALAELLIWCGDDYLMNDMGLDGMDALFKPAFERVQDKGLEQKLLEKFTAYIKELDEDYLESSDLLEGFDQTPETVRDAVANLKEVNRGSEDQEDDGEKREGAEDIEDDDEDHGDDEQEDDDEDEDEDEDDEDESDQRYLTYKDDKSDKFWEITVSGNSFTVRYGKTGSAGTENTKEFDDEEECREEAEKLIREKLKKGYQMNDLSQENADHLSEWQALVQSKDRFSALVSHFSYLASSSETRELLEAVLKRATEVSCTDKMLTVKFDDKTFLLATPPLKTIPKKYPASYQNVLRVHGTLALADNTSWGFFTLGEHDAFDLEDGWFDEDEIEKGDGLIWEFASKAKSLIVPIHIQYDGNFWIYHPTRKNKQSEPKLYYLEHDGMEFLNPQSYDNVGDFFLKEIAARFGLYKRKDDTVRLSKDFFKYMASSSEKIKDRKVVQKLKSADWQEYADEAYKSLTKHWEKLRKEAEKAAIGSFIIGWDDGGDSGIDIDFVEGNDDDAYSDGATSALEYNAISFDSFFEQEFDVSTGEDLQDKHFFEHVKNILCRMTQEVVAASTSSQAFQDINKKDYYRIWFYYWHDEDMIEMYNSKDGSLLSDMAEDAEEDDGEEEVGPEKKLVKEFTEACESKDAEEIAELIARFPEIKGAPELDHLVSLFYNQHNTWLKTGDFSSARKILKAYHDVIPLVGHTERVVFGNQTGTAMDMRQSIASDAVVLAVLANDPAVYELARRFMPEHITDAVLAYNLACYHAINKNKEDLLNYTRLAMNLGKQKKQFMAESDFDFYKKDKDFLAVLG